MVVVGIDPTSWAYEARAHPSTPYNQKYFGVSNENRTRDSGITTRGFATKLWTPYVNTLICFTTPPPSIGQYSEDGDLTHWTSMCLHMVGAQGFEP